MVALWESLLSLQAYLDEIQDGEHLLTFKMATWVMQNFRGRLVA